MNFAGITEKINHLFKKMRRKENLLPFLIFVGYFLAIALTSKVFGLDAEHAGEIVIIIVLSTIFLMIWTTAGMLVFKAFLIIGAGLSLMFFLAQSYCNLPEVDRTADNALRILFGFGLVYVAVLFTQSLHKELKDDLRSLGRAFEGNAFGYWISVPLFILSIGLFIYLFFKVVKPIILGLCIY